MSTVVSVSRTGDTEHVIRLAGSGGWERRTHEEPVWGTVVTFDLRGPSLDPKTAAAACAAAAKV